MVVDCNPQWLSFGSKEHIFKLAKSATSPAGHTENQYITPQRAAWHVLLMYGFKFEMAWVLVYTQCSK